MSFVSVIAWVFMITGIVYLLAGALIYLTIGGQ
jgi:hypothetical protein